jgi:hypothetical protein
MRRLIAVAVLCLYAGNVAAVEALPGRTFEKIGDLALPQYWGGFAISEAVDDGRVFLFGGGGASPWSQHVRRYDLPSNTWTVLPLTLPYPWLNNERYGVARASNGKYYLAPGNGPGGWGSHHRIIEVDVVAGTAVERAPVVAPGYLIWGVAVSPAPQGGIYTFGGWNGGGLPFIRHYDPVTDTTVHKGVLSVARTVGARVTHPNGRVYLFGGNTSYSVHAVDAFDTGTEVAHAVPNPSGFAFNHGTLAWVEPDGMILLWNPNASDLGFAADRIIQFDPTTEAFTDLGESPMPGGTPHSAVANGSTSSVWFFSLALPGYVWGVSGTVVPEVWRLGPSCTFAPAPWTVTRSTGAPVVESSSFTSCGGAGTLTITNVRSASAYVILNGVTIASPSSFNPMQQTLTFPVTLLPGVNQLTVELRGKPGSTLTFQLTP